MVVAAMLVAVPVTPAIGEDQRKVRTVSNGVTYRVLKVAGPNRVFVLTIDPSKDATMDVGLARPSLPGYSRTSSIATTQGAVAAVNGDFGLSPGRPGHLFAQDGELIQTTLLGTDGKNFAISLDEARSYIDSPDVTITANEVASGSTWDVAKWNVGTPGGQMVAGYSASAGTVAPTPRNSCSVRLQSASGLSWANNQSGVTRNFTVDQVACGASAMSLGGGVVLASGTTGNGADRIRGLARGETVRLTWSLGWRGVVDSIGGSPILLKDGKVMVSPCSSYLCRQHPRTAIGRTATGKILLVVVDGRQSGYSVGMTLVQLANRMKKLGAVDALNLDGGGSSTMWIRGKGVVNRPSDGSERSVTSAVLVLAHRDASDPNMSAPVIGATQEWLAPPDPAAQEVAAAAAYADPASTGGMLDYEAMLERAGR